MKTLKLYFSAIDESQFNVIAQFSKGEKEDGRSTLPFFETRIKRRTTLLMILESISFSRNNFEPEEITWMIQEGLLKSDSSDFSADYLKKIGQSLYDSLFPTGGVRDLLKGAITSAGQEQLHIQIEFNAKVTTLNRLPDYPWEMMHDGERFLVDRNITFSRCIADQSEHSTLLPVNQINVLLISSGAFDLENGLAPLSQEEHKAVREGLERSQADGHIRLYESEQASLKSLTTYLTKHRGNDAPHVLHFDGHGAFGKWCDKCHTFHGELLLTDCTKCRADLPPFQGYLLFESDDPKDKLKPNYVSSEKLGRLLQSIRNGDNEAQKGGVRLAVLSACKSAYALGASSVFNGVAQNLIGYGVPAVVAMQYTVSVKSATAFAERFYRELGNKQSLAVATSQGRVAMQNVEHNQWYRLIFYLRWQANDGGQLFAAEDLSTRKNKIANLFKVPDLPKRSLPRGEDLAALKELVLSESANKLVMTGVARKVGLQGMVGVGKSVLAAMVARDEAVRRKFPDGIIWISLGQEANLLLRQGDVAIALSRPNPSLADVEQGKTYLSELFADKACLLVLDDVWELEQIEAFNVLADQSQLLITSRDTRLTEDLDGAMGYRVGLLDDQKALELLALLAEKSPEELTEDAKAVVKECGNLPLALAMVGAMARGKSNPWASLLNRLRNADIEKIKQQFPNYPYTDLFRAIEVSIQALDSEIRERYLDFAVFPEDVPVPIAVLQTFWQAEGLDELEVEETIETLVGKSLLQQDSSQCLSLHDLQRDYLRKQVDEVGLHNKLLAAYAVQCPQGWASGSDDGYYLDRLIYHLEKAGRVDEIHDLLWQTNESGRNAWFEARDRLGQTSGYIADLRRAWELAEQNWTEATLPQVMERQCRYALIFSSLNSLSDIPNKLLEGLVKVGLPYGWTPEKGLAYARQIPDPAKRAKSLAVLIEYLLEDHKAKIWHEVLSAAQAIQYEQYRAQTLSGLAANLPQELYQEALSAALVIRDEQYLAQALVELAANLPQELYKEALSAALAIQNEAYRSNVLIALAVHFPKSYKEALSNTRAIWDEQYHSNVLIALAANLPQELYKEALSGTLAIQNEAYRSNVLIALAANLPQELYKEALSGTLAIQNETYRADALISLAAHFPEAHKEALSNTRAIQPKYLRAKFLSRLAVHFPEAYKEALSAALVIRDEQYRSNVLIVLAVNLPQELYEESLKAALVIWDEEYRFNVLIALAANLPQELYQEALSGTLVIRDEQYRSNVLIALAANLPQELYQEALSGTLVIRDEQYRSNVLIALAAHFPEVYKEALSAAQAIQDETCRADALIVLAAHFPEAYKEALSAAQAIQDETYRANVLITLAVNLPQELYKEALNATLAIRDEYLRVQSLLALVAHFPEAYKEAQNAALAIQNEFYRTYFQLELYKSQVAGSDHLELRMGDALRRPSLTQNPAIWSTIKFKLSRANALNKIIPKFTAFPTSQQYTIWQEILSQGAQRERPEFLCDLAASVPLIDNLGGKAASIGIAKSIQQVAKWWR
jgi:hypothetical protein